MDNTRIGKFIALILRHDPGRIGISLDAHGWADTRDLIAGIRLTYPEFNMQVLEEIVASDNKSRFVFSPGKTKIRACQGHSINVDVDLKKTAPPPALFHGTATRFLDSIMRDGINSGSRLYVHLSRDEETAQKVGSRHGKPAVLRVDTAQMAADGYEFYLSENGIFLTKFVPAQYLRVCAFPRE